VRSLVSVAIETCYYDEDTDPTHCASATKAIAAGIEPARLVSLSQSAREEEKEEEEEEGEGVVVAPEEESLRRCLSRFPGGGITTKNGS
jgi:hypothetical protein